MTFNKPVFNNKSKNIHASNISELCQQSIFQDSICPVNIYDCIFERKTCQNATLLKLQKKMVLQCYKYVDTTKANKQFIVNEVPLQPSGAEIKYEDLRGLVGNIQINKLAFVFKQRQLHASQHYLSADGCKTKSHN